MELKELEYERERIVEWDFVEPVKESIRIYYKPYKEGSGFKYYIVQWASSDADDSVWGDTCTIECVFFGEAYFDGIRHHYMGDAQTDNFGYINYPNLTHHVKTLEALMNLESKHCRKGDR